MEGIDILKFKNLYIFLFLNKVAHVLIFVTAFWDSSLVGVAIFLEKIN
jgi:hypothetical protein